MQLLRQHAGALDHARQQQNALAAELALTQQEMTQLQITQWRPILAAFDEQLEVQQQLLQYAFCSSDCSTPYIQQAFLCLSEYY